MFSQIPQPIIHIYKEVDKGKYRSVKHYNLSEVKNGTNLLTPMVNISKNRFFAKSNPQYWLKLREDNKWTVCATGLFKTYGPYTYFGDLINKNHLLIFKFSDNGDALTIYYFINYYTRDLSNVLRIINTM